jgi:endoribonuclease LACTB2
MLQIDSFGDVTRLAFTTRASRSVGLGVSAWFTRGALIDTGFPRVGRELEAWVREARPIGAIVTHYHEDHAGNVGRLAALGIPVQMHPETAALVRAPHPIGWYRRYTWGSPRALRTSAEPFTHPSLELRPARGHSPEHHLVWDAERGTMFGGDLFIGVKVRIAHPGEDMRAQVTALRAAVALAPERFFDAHRGPLDHPVALLAAKADWLEEMIAAIETRHRRGWSETAIRDAVLGREDLTGWVSAGDYSRLNFVRSVLRSVPPSERNSTPAELSK